jgi:hypothetical protein
MQTPEDLLIRALLFVREARRTADDTAARRLQALARHYRQIASEQGPLPSHLIDNSPDAR